IGYFSGSQSALDYQPLFSEEQRLYCALGHPLFAKPQISSADLDSCDRVLHPYRFITADEPWQAGTSSARCEQVEGSLAFILSGAHIGYLPEHIAAPWEARGQLRALLPNEQNFSVQFRLSNHRGRQPSEAQQALREDLLAAFADS
ncbi:MAG: substrate-binding domain-containing protein, partial [Pseudomonas sp.]